MQKIMVAGIGTEVGKTLVSTILTQIFKADYWKPIQCGDLENSDTYIMKKRLNPSYHQIHLPAYSFKAPLSPHHAALLEQQQISTQKIVLPHTTRPLIIEGVGGILVPLTSQITTMDLFASWNCHWIIVSKHYLGSINHTLLTFEILKQFQVSILGIIFNGIPNYETESAILGISKLSFLGRLLPETNLNMKTFNKYVTQWQPNFSQHLL